MLEHHQTSERNHLLKPWAAVLDKPKRRRDLRGSQEVKGQASGVTTCLHLSSRLLSPGREATVELLPDASSFAQLWSVWDTSQLADKPNFNVSSEPHPWGFRKTLTFLTSELFGSVVHVMIRETANRVSLEFTKSDGSICLAKDSMYFRMATFTCSHTHIWIKMSTKITMKI